MSRHDIIRRAIEVTGQASIADLKNRLGVTEMTIREDLKHLESKGVLKRLRGGAVASAIEGDISGADLLITDDCAGASALGKLETDGLVADVVRSRVL